MELEFQSKRNFCNSSNRLGGIIYESSELPVDLNNSFTILLLNRNR